MGYGPLRGTDRGGLMVDKLVASLRDKQPVKKNGREREGTFGYETKIQSPQTAVNDAKHGKSYAYYSCQKSPSALRRGEFYSELSRIKFHSPIMSTNSSDTIGAAVQRESCLLNTPWLLNITVLTCSLRRNPQEPTIFGFYQNGRS